MGDVTLNQRVQMRSRLLNGVIAQEVSVADAATLMAVSQPLGCAIAGRLPTRRRVGAGARQPLTGARTMPYSRARPPRWRGVLPNAVPVPTIYT